MVTRMEHPPHIETVQHRTTSVTLVAAELETDVRVTGKEEASEGIVIVTLSDVRNRPLPPWEPGAHVDLMLDDLPTRQYSLCGDRADHHTYRIGVLLDRDGRGSSSYVHDRLSIGDTIRVRGPRNNFQLAASPRYVFIAGGIGITPILPMVAEAEAAGAQWRLVYGGRSRASMAFLDDLLVYGDRVEIRPQDEAGMLDLDALLGVPEPDTLVYTCGPEPLLAAVEARCAVWPASALHVERFNPKPLGEAVVTDAFEVVLARSELALVVPGGRSVLEVVEEAGVGVLSSCTEGMCGTCETAVLDGTPDHRDSVLTEEEREAGDCMMICVSRSLTPRLTLDL
jgi:ferredoxin-NADP reductase